MRIITILILSSVVLVGLSGCKSNRSKEFITQEELVKVAPIADQYTPNVVMEICDAEYNREYSYALARAEDSKKKRIDCDRDYSGGFTCEERSSSGGGFWGGVASALNKRSAAKRETNGLKETCYLKYGYRMTKKVVRNPYYQTDVTISDHNNQTVELSKKSFQDLQLMLDNVSRWSDSELFGSIRSELNKRCRDMGRRKYNTFADRCTMN